jgi:hypothetical protein
MYEYIRILLGTRPILPISRLKVNFYEVMVTELTTSVPLYSMYNNNIIPKMTY